VPSVQSPSAQAAGTSQSPWVAPSADNPLSLAALCGEGGHGEAGHACRSRTVVSNGGGSGCGVGDDAAALPHGQLGCGSADRGVGGGEEKS